jgi:hypothetical protein
MPVTHGTCYKHVIFSTELNDGRISPGTVRNIFMCIIDHVRVIQVDWVTISFLLGVGGTAEEKKYYYKKPIHLFQFIY